VLLNCSLRFIFDKGGSATQSADEATVKGQRNDNQLASMTMLLLGSFSPTFRPGPIPTTLPRMLPVTIPIAYNALDSYLKGPSAIEGIAQLLERIGVPSEVLRGPEISNYNTPPKILPGFPGAIRDTPKAGRARWLTPDGKILEWDYQHGDVEVYNKRGKHQGSANPYTGQMTKKPVAGRKTKN
jgi:hypothetical protein